MRAAAWIFAAKALKESLLVAFCIATAQLAGDDRKLPTLHVCLDVVPDRPCVCLQVDLLEANDILRGQVLVGVTVHQENRNPRVSRFRHGSVFSREADGVSVDRDYMRANSVLYVRQLNRGLGVWIRVSLHGVAKLSCCRDGTVEPVLIVQVWARKQECNGPFALRGTVRGDRDREDGKSHTRNRQQRDRVTNHLRHI